jgi:hypothetical protein
MFLRSAFRDNMLTSGPLCTPDTWEEAPSGSKCVSPSPPVATGVILHTGGGCLHCRWRSNCSEPYYTPERDANATFFWVRDRIPIGAVASPHVDGGQAVWREGAVVRVRQVQGILESRADGLQ